MAQPDFDSVKIVIRSILTSSQRSITISQLLNDYVDYEGTILPSRQLGYDSCYDLLLDLKDVLKVPPNPNMNSVVKLVVDEKTSHIRELISRQKPKKKTSKKRSSSHSSYNSPFKQNCNSTIKFHGNNRYTNDSKYNHNTSTNHYNIRGYDYVKQDSSSLHKPKGFVTSSLQHDIEDLCRKSKSTSVYSLKCCLIDHRDYKKLNVSNIEEAIKMLKFFIYIENGSVHLKDSSHEIFPRNDIKPGHINLQNIIDEDEELLNDDVTDDEFVDDDYETVNSNYETGNESSLEGSSSLQSKSSDVFMAQNRNSVVSTAESAYNSAYTSFESKFEIKIKEDETSNFKPFNDENIDYKKMIASIIKESNEPITVNQVLEMFEIKYGYKFPFQKFSCKTCLDYFRLFPAMFKLDNPYSTNSFIRVEEGRQIQTQRKTTLRNHLIDSSIINYCHYDDSEEKFSSIYEKYVAESSLESKNHQQLNHIQNNASSSFPSNPYDEYDSDMVLDSMKEKMRVLLLKHEHGILCNEFMDVYANEYCSGFVYNEYGFKSMKDMAYQLPSVFYVKENNESNQCVLYNAYRRNELENSLNDPTEFYKNIPKTVLCNLSKFFKKHSSGVDLKKLKTLYCSDYGRSYEPIKYGYSSEKHMFESLNKMVEIHDDMVYTIDPYAYTDFVKNEDLEVQNAKISPIIPNHTPLNSKDVCGQDFEYLGFKLRKKKGVSVYVGEIYNPGFFYIQMASDVNNLKCFMNELQSFYNTNEEKYKLLPEYVQVGLPCASCFEDSMLWHRAKVMKIVDDLNVQVLYVDYGSVEVIAKSGLRLLEIRFGALPIQALPCTLFENNDQRFSRKINDKFAELVDNDQTLEATIKNSISNSIKHYVVELFLYLKNVKTSVNKVIKDELRIEACETKESARRLICKVMAYENDKKNFKDEDIDDENIYNSD